MNDSLYFLSELKVATKRCVCEYIFLCYTGGRVGYDRSGSVGGERSENLLTTKNKIWKQIIVSKDGDQRGKHSRALCLPRRQK